MKIIKSSFYPLILEFIKWGISSSFLFLGVTNNNYPYLINANILISMVAYFLLHYILYLGKPILISVSIKNKISNEKYTQIFAQSNTPESERTASIVLCITKKSSVFSWLYIKLLKGKQCQLTFNTLPANYCVLYPDKTGIVKTHTHGFTMDLSSIIVEFLEKESASIERTIDFVIFASREEAISNSMKIDIVPTYLLNSKKISFIHSLFYDIKAEGHLVKYLDGYMGIRKPYEGVNSCLITPRESSIGS